MALKDDPKVQAMIDRATQQAVKAERQRVAAKVKAIELPEGTTARAGADIKRALKEAIAAD